MDLLLPGTEIDYPVLLPGKALVAGKYGATIALTYASSALGYRRSPGREQRVTRTFGFEVTSGQYTTLFKGVPPVRRPARAKASQSASPLLWLAAGLGALVLLLVAVAVAVVVRRRA